jgi:uncharacterized protein
MAKKLQVILDTNVVVSAILFKGKPRKINEFALNEKFRVVTSSILLSELTGLLVKKFSLSLTEIHLIEKEITEMAEVVYPKESIYIVRDIDDNRVLEAAVEGECDYVITGDADLLDLKSYKRITIITPAEFLEILEKSE